jgi:hypothetical protein
VPEAPRRFRLLRRVVPLLLVGAFAAWYFHDTPRDVALIWDLGARSQGLQVLRVDVLRLPDRALVRHAELFWTSARPAPDKVRQPIRLAPGDYQAELSLDWGARTERLERRFALERQEEIVVTP